MPNSRPVMTLPMTRPRSVSWASVAAKGTRIWPTTEPVLTTTAAAASTCQVGAVAITSNPAAVTVSITFSSRRRSIMSPSGTRNASPSAYPTCPAVTTRPTAVSDAWRLSAIAATSGCA